MATYILEPNESTSHSHKTITKSALLEGEVELIIGDNRIEMKLNEPIEVPADTKHTMINKGEKTARVACYDC